MKYRLAFATAAMMVASPAFAQTSSAPSPDAPPPPPPPAVATPPAPAAADMQAVLDAHASLMPKPIERLTPRQARVQPSAADAVITVLQARGMPTDPDMSVTTMDKPYGTDKWQFARIYKPAAAQPGQKLPVIVYYHGGGWVIADVGTYDAGARTLARDVNAIVVSVEYRHAPEAKFPAQHDDAAMAYRWVLANAAAWGGDLSKVTFAGESAGGNLAVATAIYARDNRLPAPKAVVSIYPIANSSMTLPSRTDSANAKPLNTAMLKWFGHYYTATPADMQDPRINLVGANLRDLPPVTIINAQIDPLRSDGETLETALRNAGNRVERKVYPGVTHEFFGMGKVVRGAYDANAYAVSRIRAAIR